MVVGVAAHTIGHREITIINNSTTGDDNNDASDDGTDIGSNANLSTIGVADTLTGSTVSESNEIRQLVVVSVRGSVSMRDWAADFANQINLECINFKTGYQEVIDSLYGVEHCEEHNSVNQGTVL